MAQREIAGWELAPTISDDPAIWPSPAWALAAWQAPTEAHFRRDHFAQPELDLEDWSLAIDGEVVQSLQLGREQLGALPFRRLRVVLECAGHRRSELIPPTEGVPWSTGAVSEAIWGGVSLADVLARAAPTTRARVVVLQGGDRGQVPGRPGDVRFARAIPIEKALQQDTLLAWEMNGEPLPPGHGAPLRAIVPGWYGTHSVKWLTSIQLQHQDLACAPDTVTPTLPVHALLSEPADREIPAVPLQLSGIAWGGRGGVASVELSIDGGPWQRARVEPARGDYARTFWFFAWHPEVGVHEVSVRATDEEGATQPVAPVWNPRGYGNASIRRETFSVS